MRGPVAHVVVVDDEPIVRRLMAQHLGQAGFRVSEAGDARGLEALLAQGPVDILILDIMLPDRDGLSLTRELSGQGEMGIILVSQRREDVDRIVGLEIGADDYLCKPFVPRELVARVSALRRRQLQAGSRREAAQFLRFEGWTFDLNARALSDGQGGVSRLTAGEYQLLACLLRHPGQVVRRERLLGLLCEYGDGSLRSVDVLISRLRRKLGDDPRQPRYIVTVHGEGYSFAPQVY